DAGLPGGLGSCNAQARALFVAVDRANGSPLANDAREHGVRLTQLRQPSATASSVSRTSISRPPRVPSGAFASSVRSSPTASACSVESPSVPIAPSRARSSAFPRWNASQRESALTISSSGRSARAGSGLVDIGGEKDIFADRFGCQTRQRDRRRKLAEQPRPFPGHGRCHEEKELVDEVLQQECRRERRATLQQQ